MATFKDSALPVRGMVTALLINCSIPGRMPLPSLPITISPSVAKVGIVNIFAVQHRRQKQASPQPVITLLNLV